MGIEAEKIINAIDIEINKSRSEIVDLDNIAEFKDLKINYQYIRVEVLVYKGIGQKTLYYKCLKMQAIKMYVLKLGKRLQKVKRPEDFLSEKGYLEKYMSLRRDVDKLAMTE